MKTMVLLFGCIVLLQDCIYQISKDLVAKTDKAITFEMPQSNSHV